jgi:hypothetical protein
MMNASDQKGIVTLRAEKKPNGDENGEEIKRKKVGKLTHELILSAKSGWKQTLQYR